MLRTVIYALFLLLGALAYRIGTSPVWQDAISGAAVSLFKPLLVPVVLAIAAPAFVYVVSFLIVLAAIAACVSYWLLDIRRRQGQIDAVRGGLRTLPMPTEGGAGPFWTQAMPAIGTLLRGNEIFVSAWSEYQARAIQSGQLPSAPFSHFVASEPGGRSRAGFMQSLPGYFTSLGLIFTFVGLVVALYFAAKGFRSGNIDEARAAIVQLLNTASFKFLTSVAALISAMTVSLFLRFNLASLGRKTDALAEHIESFLSIWRDRMAVDRFPSAGQEPALSARLELLLDRIERLTDVVEILARRDRPRLVETDNAVHG